MTFDAGTWWLITIIVTTVVGLVGFLFGRSVFRQLDENRADIKQVRENYTPRDDHQKDLERLRTAHQKDVEALRREMKEMRTEMRTEIRQMSDDVKDCALPGFVDSKNEEKTERNAGYLVVSHSGGGMLRQGTRKGIRRTPANRGMRAHRIVKSLDISEDVCHGLCP